MPQLPSESLYGSNPAVVETQLRYTPLIRQPWDRVIAALKPPPLALQLRETRRGHIWLRIGLYLLVGGLLLDVPYLRFAGLCLLGFVVALALWDAVSLVGLRYSRRFTSTVHASGYVDEPRAFVGEALEMKLQLSNRKPLPLSSVVVEDIIPAAAQLEEIQLAVSRATGRQELRLFWMPGALQTLTRSYHLRCVKRGFHTFGPAKLHTGDGAGFFSRTVTLVDPQQLTVYPRIYSATELGLPIKNPFGELLSKQRLVEDPLHTAGVREWQPGDGLRRVHWKATAVHQRVLSRLYEPSAETQLLIVLNVATLERYWEGRVPEMAERAISVAGSVAALALESRMPVGLLVNAYWPGSDQVLRLMPGRSTAQLGHILEMLAAVDLPNQPVETQLLREAPRLPWGATVVVVSAVVYPAMIEAMERLAQAGRQLVLFALGDDPITDAAPHIIVYHVPSLDAGLLLPTKVQPC